jgi:cell division protein FtsW
MKKGEHIDKFFLWTTLSILIIGIFMFISASLGILPKSRSLFYSVIFTQVAFGLGGGLLAMYITYKIPYTFWKKYSLYFFVASIGLTLLVFVPGLGISHGGAERWVSFGSFSFQPVEFLKLSFIMYFSAWLAWYKSRNKDMKTGLLVFCGLFLLVAFILLKQPDTKSLILLLLAGVPMLFIAGLDWKYIALVFVGVLVGFAMLVFFKPYLWERVNTFINPKNDLKGSSYQINQSLIAIGSGKLLGRGYGQSVQKFSYLPEPQGDSIFAVIGEEFGFVGTTVIVILFLIFALRGLRIANRAPDMFSRLLVIGIVILIVAQSYLNIAALTGVFPLTGVPLVFISHGGTSLLFSLAAVGIVLQISKHRIALQKTTK